MHRIEKSGVLVFRLPFLAETFDALSAWSAESEMRPLLALGQAKSGDRDRATIAHELGHLVLHSVFLGGDLMTIEREAGAFAGELLMPEADMHEEVCAPVTLTRLAELKSKWGVSMQYVLKRLGDLELISAQQKSYWRGKMDKQGWLENEPVPMPPDNPSLVRQMMESVYGAPVDARRVAQELAIPARLVADIVAANARAPVVPTPGSGEVRPMVRTGAPVTPAPRPVQEERCQPDQAPVLTFPRRR